MQFSLYTTEWTRHLVMATGVVLGDEASVFEKVQSIFVQQGLFEAEKWWQWNHEEESGQVESGSRE